MKKRLSFLLLLVFVFLLSVYALAENEHFTYDPETGRISGEIIADGNVEIWLDGALAGGSRLSVEAGNGEHTVEVFVNGVKILVETVTVSGAPEKEESGEEDIPPETEAPAQESSAGSSVTAGDLSDHKNVVLIAAAAAALILIVLAVVLIAGRKRTGKHVSGSKDSR